MEPLKIPRVFISYSWESEDHKKWVRYLGERLYKAGIEARLDQWFVKAGESFTAFMEQEVEKADFVLVVCTPTYAQKSNNRHGGVGYEQQIVSGQLMAGIARSKFIPILRNGDYELGTDCAIPSHFGGIAWIEFRNDTTFEESLEDLIRVIHSKPRFMPPPLGVTPFLETSSTTEVTQFESTKDELSQFLFDSDEEQTGRTQTILRKSSTKNTELDRVIRQSQNLQMGNMFKAVKRNKMWVLSALLLLLVSSTIIWWKIGDSSGRIKQNEEFAPKRRDPPNEGEFQSTNDNFDIDASTPELKNAEDYNSRGVAYGRKGEYAKAISDFNIAIGLRPGYATAYDNRGHAYSLQGDFARAIPDFNTAIELKPDYYLAYYNRGYAYKIKDDKTQAIDDFTNAIKLKPDYVNAYSNRGIVYSDLGDNIRAISDYNKAIELRPDKASYYYNRGLAHKEQGNNDQAIIDFQKSLKLVTSPSDRIDALHQLQKLGAK